MRTCGKCGMSEDIPGGWRTKMDGGERVLFCPACRKKRSEEEKNTMEYREKKRAASKKYKDSNKEKVREQRHAYRRRSREKKRAWGIVQAEVSAGRMRIPVGCQLCGGWGRLVAHHFKGYENATDVVFLCDRCHMKSHRSKLPLPFSESWDRAIDNLGGVPFVF